MRLIDKLFPRKKLLCEEAAESEILTSVLIPSGHHDRFILKNQVEAFFAPYMEYIGNSLEQVYGINDKARRQRRLGDSYHSTFVDTPFLHVEYKISPLETLDARPSVFYGEMKIKQPKIHLGLAGKLHRRLLDAHPGQGFTLSYSPGDDAGFQIFHSKGNEILSQGENLLQKMDVGTPELGISYMQWGNTRLWQRVPVELRQ